MLSIERPSGAGGLAHRRAAPSASTPIPGFTPAGPEVSFVTNLCDENHCPPALRNLRSITLPETARTSSKAYGWPEKTEKFPSKKLQECDGWLSRASWIRAVP